MTMTRDEIIKTLENLPPDATIEDAMEHLVLLMKIQRGLEQSRTGQGISQEEMRARMARRLQQ